MAVVGTQGFHKPHDHEIRKHVSMFDQPYRQHKAVEHGLGHQVCVYSRVCVCACVRACRHARALADSATKVGGCGREDGNG